MTPKPPVVGDENGEDPAEALAVGWVTVVLPLRPRHNVGPRARRVEALEAVLTVEGADLTADKPVGVLPGVEVVQGTLEVEGAPSVAGEQQDEGRIPHEQAVVEGRVDKVGDEAAAGGRLAKVSEREHPYPPVAGHRALVPFPERVGQDASRLVERRERGALRRHLAEDVSLHERFPEMGV